MSQISNVNSPVLVRGRGKKGLLYILDGEKYDIHFPIEWVYSHKAKPEFPQAIPGPKYCEGCKNDGSINGVFVAYCTNCAYHVFDGLREGIPINVQNAAEVLHKLSYMKGVSLSEIGIGDGNPETDMFGPPDEDDELDYADESDELDEDDMYVDIYYSNDIKEREMRQRRKNYHQNE